MRDQGGCSDSVWIGGSIRSTSTQTETSSLSPRTSPLRESVFQPSVMIHDTSFHCLMKCDVDLHKHLHAMSCCQVGTTIFQRIVERMTKESTMMAASTARSRWLLPIRYGLENLSCLVSAFSASDLAGRASIVRLLLAPACPGRKHEHQAH